MEFPNGFIDLVVLNFVDLYSFSSVFVSDFDIRISDFSG